MSKIHLIQTRPLSFPAERVWQALADFGHIHYFNPMVETSPLLDERSSGIGASRHCQGPGGLSIVEEVIDWQEGRSYTVAIRKTTMPIHNATATMAVRAGEAGTSIASLGTSYEPRFGLLGRLLDWILLRHIMTFGFARILKGLETHLRTGRWIGLSGRPQQAVIADSRADLAAGTPIA